MLRYFIALPVILALAACGAPASKSSQRGERVGQMPPTAAAVYCQRSGGQLIARVSGGRRADLCKLPNGRTVRAAELLNSHNSL